MIKQVARAAAELVAIALFVAAVLTWAAAF